MEKRYFEISWGSLWRALAFVLALIVLYLIKEILILLASAIIIASICQPWVNFLQKKKVSRLLGTSFVFILILVILGVFFWLVVPLVISQFGNFITNFNETIVKIGNQSFLTEIIQQLIINLKAAFDILAKGATAVFDLIFSIFEKSTARIGRWFQGRIILSFIVGLLSWLGFYLLGMKYSGTLALLAAVLENIPLDGAIFAGLIAFLVALTDSWLLAVWVVIFFALVQQLENVLLTPLVMKKTTGLSPLVVLLALLIGTKIAGLIGFLLAIPATIIIQEIFEEGGRRKTRV